MVEQLEQINAQELLSPIESSEVVINHEFIMILLCDICLGAAGIEKMDSRAIKVTKSHSRQDKGVTKITGHKI